MAPMTDDPLQTLDDDALEEMLCSIVSARQKRARPARAWRGLVPEQEATTVAAAAGVDVTLPLNARALLWARSNCPILLLRNAEWIEADLRVKDNARQPVVAAECAPSPCGLPGAAGAETPMADVLQQDVSGGGMAERGKTGGQAGASV